MRHARNVASCAAAALLLHGAPQGKAAPPTSAPPAEMVQIPAGAYRLFLRGENDVREIPVRAFWLDVQPVTNGEFLEFTRENPKWRRSQVKRLFADEQYLQHWIADLDIGDDPQAARRPVVFVSWFAAKAYCAWKGRRLPSTPEWERAAGAGFTNVDGKRDAEFARILSAWYSGPSPEKLPAVGAQRPNFWGARDLHGLVWEWTSDFNSALMTGDARGDSALDRQLFCAAGALRAANPADYAAFMRFGFRSSLKAGYAVHNLGFRCARDL